MTQSRSMAEVGDVVDPALLAGVTSGRLATMGYWCEELLVDPPGVLPSGNHPLHVEVVPVPDPARDDLLDETPRWSRCSQNASPSASLHFRSLHGVPSGEEELIGAQSLKSPHWQTFESTTSTALNLCFHSGQPPVALRRCVSRRNSSEFHSGSLRNCFGVPPGASRTGTVPRQLTEKTTLLGQEASLVFRFAIPIRSKREGAGALPPFFAELPDGVNPGGFVPVVPFVARPRGGITPGLETVRDCPASSRLAGSPVEAPARLRLRSPGALSRLLLGIHSHCCCSETR